MTAYKRFPIPIKNGRLLAERLQDNTIRLTMFIKQPVKKPLDLWLFDKERAYRYPNTLYADKSGNLSLRRVLRDTGLEEVCCVCLIDSERQPEIVGYSGEKIDWQGILLKGGTEQKAEQQEEKAETFKDRVRDMVEQFDEQLSPVSGSIKADMLPEDLDWKKTDLYGLAQDKRLWRYARNPFVSEKCKKHEHLLIAENDKFCFLGVPCRPEEKYIGRSQGFRISAERSGVYYCVLKREK